MAAGSISAEQFVESVESFMQQCLLLHDRWELKISVNGEKYICKKQSVGVLEPEGNKGSHLTDELGLEEDCSSVSIPPVAVITSEYHIVYSHSYAVPVLYFNVYKSDGKLLSLEEVWETVPEYHRGRLKEERWTFLTQQDHPLLNRPFYQLHPCHTTDFMKQALTMGVKSENYLMTWLSSVAPVVGLQLPLQLGHSIAPHVT